MHDDGEREREIDLLRAALAEAEESLARIVQREGALEASEERYRLVARAANELLWDLQLDARRMHYSDAMQSVFLHSLVGELDYDAGIAFWLANIHDDDRARIVASFEAARDGADDQWAEEYRFRRGDGTYADVLDRACIVRDENGRATRVVGSTLDVSDRKGAEAARHRLASIVECSTDAMIGVRVDGIIETWNKGAEQLFGYPAEEIIGRPGRVLAHPNRKGEMLDLKRRVLDGETITGFETLRRRRDGSIIDVSLSLSPTRDAGGETVGVSVVVRDISERKRLHAQLAMADRMASLGTLAAGVAHEINNPLAYVLANLEHLTNAFARLPQGPVREELEKRMPRLGQALADARDGALRVTQIVRDLRTLSRSDEDVRRPLSLNDVLDLVTKIAAGELRHRGSLVKDYAAVPLVEANEGRLQQVFLNLVVNAAQALPEGEPDRHTVRVSTRTDAAGRAVVEVTDSGVGISPEHRRRVFEPFFTTKSGVGTGLGLSICHGIVTSLGGEIVAESDAGRGTTFRVTLPASRGVLPAGHTDARVPVPVVRRRARVLIVDDEPKLGQAICGALSDEFDFVVLTDGSQALDHLTSGARFDVILCDLMMPVVTGMELYDELKRTAPDQALRMVFLTGGAFAARARAFLDAVTNPRLEKPFELERLREVVRMVID